MSKLETIISDLYQGSITEKEVKEASENLIKFFKITEVKIDFIKPQDGIIAFASVVIDDAICLSSIAIHKKLSAEGYRVTYPSKGKFSIFHPINKDAGSAIERAILTKLNEVMINVYDRHDNADDSVR